MLITQCIIENIQKPNRYFELSNKDKSINYMTYGAKKFKAAFTIALQ